MEDENEINRFVEYIVDFPESIRKLPAEVWIAILEEMLVDAVVDRIPKDPKNFSLEELEEIKLKAFKESTQEIVERLKTFPKSGNDFWKNVPQIEGDSENS